MDINVCYKDYQYGIVSVHVELVRIHSIFKMLLRAVKQKLINIVDVFLPLLHTYRTVSRYSKYQPFLQMSA